MKMNKEMLLCTGLLMEGADYNGDYLDEIMIDVDSVIGALYDLKEFGEGYGEVPYDRIIKHLQSYSRILTRGVKEIAEMENEGVI